MCNKSAKFSYICIDKGAFVMEKKKHAQQVFSKFIQIHLKFQVHSRSVFSALIQLCSIVFLLLNKVLVQLNVNKMFLRTSCASLEFYCYS